MIRSSNSNPDRLIYRQPIGWGVFIGLPFYLFFTALGGLMWFAEPFPVKEGVGLLVFLFFFSIWMLFVVSTAVHWFGRVGVDIDRSAGTVTTSWGLFFPLFPSDHRLERFRAVLLDFQVRTCGKSKIHEYIVVLSDGKDQVKVGRGSDYAPMRTVAEEIARFIELPLLDVSDGSGRVIDLRPVVRRTEAAAYRSAPSLPMQPAAGTLQFEKHGDQATVQLPTTGIGCFVFFLLFVFMVVVGLGFLGVECKWNWKVMAIYGGISALILSILGLAAVPTRQSVIADPEKLTIKNHGLVFATATKIPWDEVKEVHREFKSVTVLSNSKRISVGSARVTEEDASWLRDMMYRYWRG
jgi:hypothetical protein